MIGAFGDLLFETNTAPSTFERSLSYNYSKQERVIGKPTLQVISGALEQIKLSMRFHANFCNPQTQVQKIRDMADEQTAYPLTVNQKYQGAFVIESLAEKYEQMDDDGFPLLVIVELSLLERALLQ